MLENLKSKGLIKSQLVLDLVDRNKAIVFIDLLDKTKNQELMLLNF